MGKVKSLATEADYASVLRTANHFKAEADQLRSLNAEMREALAAVESFAVLIAKGQTIKEYAIPGFVLERVSAAIKKAEG